MKKNSICMAFIMLLQPRKVNNFLSWVLLPLPAAHLSPRCICVIHLLSLSLRPFPLPSRLPWSFSSWHSSYRAQIRCHRLQEVSPAIPFCAPPWCYRSRFGSSLPSADHKSEVNKVRHEVKWWGQILANDIFCIREKSLMNWTQLQYVQRWPDILKGECGSKEGS